MKNSIRYSGNWSMHCYHDILITWCFNYYKRKEQIAIAKPLHEHERELRKRLFKLLPDEAVQEISEKVKKAWAKCYKALIEYEYMRVKCEEVWVKCKEAKVEYVKAMGEYQKALTDWNGKDTFHTKWCGCKEWDGKEIVFPST